MGSVPSAACAGQASDVLTASTWAATSLRDGAIETSREIGGRDSTNGRLQC